MNCFLGFGLVYINSDACIAPICSQTEFRKKRQSVTLGHLQSNERPFSWKIGAINGVVDKD